MNIDLNSPFGSGDEQDDTPAPDEESGDSSDAQAPFTDEFNDSGLSDRELRKEIRQANQEFEKADSKLEQFRANARELLRKGSQAESSDKRKTLALLVRQVKQRAAVMKLKQQAALRDLFKYTLQKEVQSIQEMLEEELNRESPMDKLDVDSDEFTEEFDEVAASIKAQTEEMTEMLQEVSNSVEEDSTDFALETFPEEEQMDSIAEEHKTEEEIEFDVELGEPDASDTVTETDVPAAERSIVDAATNGGDGGAENGDNDDDDLARSLAS